MRALQRTADLKNITLTDSLDDNAELIKGIFIKDSILRTRRITAANGISFCLFYFDGMVNNEIINESVVRPLIMLSEQTWNDRAAFVSERVLFSGDVKICTTPDEMISALLYGDALLLIDGTSKALTINTKGWRVRSISEPENERVLEGPREGFGEAAMFNVAMIRRKLLTPDLAVEVTRIGRRTDTYVFICYLSSLCEEKTLRLLKDRLSKIDIDGLLDSNYINEHIRDSKTSLFKTTGRTERPDTVAANLLEGRIAIVVDGTPTVLTVPYLFSENFQSDEDYYVDYKMATVGRLLRIICFVISISATGVYLALVTFHSGLLPPDFALSVAEARAGVPFSPTTECIALILIFEILKEAGLRMSQNVGHALSIVGGLVVGQSAVEARLVSAPLLIAVAMSGIAGLMLPRLREAVFFYRIVITVAASFLGLYGVLTVLVVMLSHITSLRSFGIDYTQSLRRISPESSKDTLTRRPWPFMKTRPDIQTKNRKRQI